MECARRRKELEEAARYFEFEDAQVVQQSGGPTVFSFENTVYVTQQYNKRPSVIYFNGRLNRESSESKTDCSCTPSERNIPISDTNTSAVTEDSQLQDLSESGEDDCQWKKRHRTSFNSFQLKRLEEEFEGDNYIIGMKRWQLSEELDIPEKQIKIWFQNRRTKSKRHRLMDCHRNSTEYHRY